MLEIYYKTVSWFLINQQTLPSTSATNANEEHSEHSKDLQMLISWHYLKIRLRHKASLMSEGQAYSANINQTYN